MSARQQNHFELFGIEPAFRIDDGQLAARYREISKEVHPDRHVGEEASERVKALQTTMTLNEAYKTLKDPARRAEYLLQLRGLVIAEHERIEPTMIAEILEAREELAEALARDDRDELGRLEEAMLDRKDDLLDEVERLFDEVGVSASVEALAPIKKQLIVLRYVNRYLEQFEGVEDDERAA